MFKILKYLKKSVVPILIIVILLVVQAVCDLSLPDYTAKIVNVGIQQGGIENAVPEIIRESELDRILLFTDAANKDIVLGNYTLLDKNTLSATDYDEYSSEYPLLADEPLYKLNVVDTDTSGKLDEILGKPILIVSAIEKGSDQITAMTDQLRAAFPEGTLPEDATIFDMISLMPDEQRSQILSDMSGNTQISSLSDSQISQAAVTFVKAEYQAIGLDTDGIQMSYIVSAGLKMLGLTLISVLAAILVTLLSSQVAAKLGMNLRGKVFDKVVSFSNNELDKFGIASLITRTTNDIQQIQMLMVMIFRMIIYAPILGVYGVIKALNTNSQMSWIIGVGLLAILALVIVLFVIAMPRFKKLQQLVDKLNLIAREILTGLPVIRAFDNQKHEEKRFDIANMDLTKTNLFVNRLMAIMMPTMMLVMNGITLLIIWVGGGYIDAGAMQVGDMMAFMQYAMQIVMAFLMLSMVSIILPRASVSANRIVEVLDSDVLIEDPKNPKSFDTSKKGQLEFKDVSFRYPDAEEDVLSHISFTAKPGETTALIGSTGSGKSTVVNLIPRFYDVTSGEILIDGSNIKDVTQHDLRDKLGFVPQKGILFSGTIESNIKFGNTSATEQEVQRAARIAQATDFIEEKTEKYADPISQGGTNVSGGQRQRLSIARAIAKNPEIYIFDDSFSALDYKTDVTLRRALKEETKDSTVIIITQRVSTILHADQIIVLDEGKIAGIGTHKELMENCDVYSQIASAQLSKEELANE
ncbi:MAG: ABC transporter ATP-binding protein [Anaerolineaceae bacterium]